MNKTTFGTQGDFIVSTALQTSKGITPRKPSLFRRALIGLGLMTIVATASNDIVRDEFDKCETGSKANYKTCIKEAFSFKHAVDFQDKMKKLREDKYLLMMDAEFKGGK